MASDIRELTLGIDPGLRKTGVVLMDRDYTLISANLIEVEASPAKRLWDIEQSLEHLILPQVMDNHITVFIEGYNYGAKFQRESLAELGGVLRRYFYLNNLIYWVIPPKSLKLYVTGNGSAVKNFMKKCSQEKWGVSFKSDDVCDAYGLARLGTTVLNYRDRKRIYHKDPAEAAVVADIGVNPEHYRGANTAKRPAKGK